MSAFEDVVEAWGFKIAGDKPAVLSPAGIAPDGSIVYSDAESFRDLIGAEPELGNPSVNGWILSSSSAGVRSWVAPNTHSHSISDVTGLQSALDARMATASYPDLVAIEALAGTSGLLRKTATNTWSLDTASYALSSAIPVASSTAPSALGTASVGTGSTWARADHVHAMPTAAQVGAAASGHNHTLDSLSNVTITSNAAGEILKWSGTAWVNSTLSEAGIQPAGSYASSTHSHAISDVANLQTALYGKEAVLGNPTTNGYILSSTTAGVRSWVPLPTIPVASVFGRTGAVEAASGDYTTAQVTESGNLYYTDARARAAISASAPLSYSGGVVSHLATDGNLHVPATSTTNNGKALVAGSTAGSIAWTSLAISHITSLQTTLDAKMASASYPDLVAIEALAGTSGLLRKTAANAWSLDTASYALASAVPAASSTTPSALGAAAVGTGTTWARADHAHAMPTAAQVGAAAASHSHAIADVTALQSALDGKQAALGYTPVNKAGDTMTGGLTLSAGNLNVNAGVIQTAGVTRISSGGAGTLTTLSTTGLATLAQAAVSDLPTMRMVSTTTGGRLQALDAAGSRALIGAATATDANLGTTLISADGVDPFTSRASFDQRGGVRSFNGVGPFGGGWYNVVDVRHRNTASPTDFYGGELVWGIGTYQTRMAFRSRDFSGNPTAWTEVWTNANLTNLNQLANGPGYITGNQTITLYGIVTGFGATSITTSIADGALSIAKTNGLQTALDARMATASFPDLVAIEALSGTSGFLKKTAANTWALDTNTYLTTTGTAASATKLATGRTLTIGSTGKAFDGTANVAWTLAEIGAASSSHTHTVANLSNLGANWSGLLTSAKPTTLAGYGITDAQPLDSDLTAIAALSTQAFGRSLLTQADEASARTAIGTKRKATVLRPSAIPGSGVSTEVVWTTIQVDLDYIVDFWYYTGGGACTLRIYDGSQNSSKIFYSASLPASNAAYHMRICFQADTSAGAFVTINGVPEARAKTDLSLMTGTLIFTAQGNGGVGAYLVPGQLTYTQAG